MKTTVSITLHPHVKTELYRDMSSKEWEQRRQAYTHTFPSYAQALKAVRDAMRTWRNTGRFPMPQVATEVQDRLFGGAVPGKWTAYWDYTQLDTLVLKARSSYMNVAEVKLERTVN